MTTTADLSPEEGARWALRAGTPLDAGRLDVVTATANHIQGVLTALRGLDFGETAPAATYRAASGAHITAEGADRAAA